MANRHGARKWGDVPGKIILDIASDEFGVWKTEAGVILPPEVQAELLTAPDITAQLIIHFRSSGYYEPASMYGGRDRVGWPEEGEDVREVDGATASTDIGELKLSDTAQEALYYAFENQIYMEALDHD